MSEEEEKEIIRRLCHFAPTGAASYVRDLHDFLIEHALAAMDEERPLSSTEVLETVNQQYPIHFEMEDIIQSLKRLRGSGKMYCTTGPRTDDPEARFGVDVETRARLQQEIAEQVEFESSVLAEWLELMAERYPTLDDTQLDLLREDLLGFARPVFMKHGAECLSLIYSTDEEAQSFIDAVEAEASLSLPSRPSALHEIRMRELPAFFREATTRRKRYIAQLLNSIFLLRMMQLDPKCAALMRAELREGSLYLDTNVVYRLLGLNGPHLQTAVKTVIELSRGLEFDLFVTPVTIKEFRVSLKHAAKQLSGRQALPRELLPIAIDYTSQEDFMKAYWRANLESRGSISIEDFVATYDNVEVLLSEFGVEVCDTLCDSLANDQLRLAAEISRLYRSIEEYAADRAERADVEYSLPHEAVVEHDAFHRALILELRPRELNSYADARVWWLTCDTKLLRYDRFARRGTGGIPYCTLSAQWLQIIKPFFPPSEDLDVAFADMLTSPYLRAYPIVTPEVGHQILGRIALIQPYSPQLAARVMLDRHFIEQFEKTQTEEERLELIQSQIAMTAEEWRQGNEKLIQQLARIRKETIPRLEQEKTELARQFQMTEQQRTEEIGRLQSELEELRRSHNAVLKVQEERQKRIHSIIRWAKWGAPALVLLVMIGTLLVLEPWATLPDPWGFITTLVMVGFALTSLAVPLGGRKLWKFLGYLATVAAIADLVYMLWSLKVR